MEVDVFGPGEVQNQFTVKTVRHNPAAVGAVTGNATYASFLSSLLGKNFIIFVMSSPGMLTPFSGCFLVLWKPLLVHFCVVVWVLFSVMHFSLLYCVINAQNGTQTASYCNNTLRKQATAYISHEVPLLEASGHP